MEAWKIGSLEDWKPGNLEAWKLGSLEAWKLRVESGSAEAYPPFRARLRGEWLAQMLEMLGNVTNVENVGEYWEEGLKIFHKEHQEIGKWGNGMMRFSIQRFTKAINPGRGLTIIATGRKKQCEA